MKTRIITAALIITSIIACKNETEDKTNTTPVPIQNPNDGSSHQNPVYPDSAQQNLLPDSIPNSK